MEKTGEAGGRSRMIGRSWSTGRIERPGPKEAWRLDREPERRDARRVRRRLRACAMTIRPHKLMRVSNTKTYGVEPVFTVCTCGGQCEPTTQLAMQAAFDAHTQAMGVGLVAVPWRSR